MSQSEREHTINETSVVIKKVCFKRYVSSNKFLHTFSGETSTGKSTLINKLIGHDALVWGTLETTRKIYRVMHSEKMTVRTYKWGCPEPTEHSFNSVHELHEMLKHLEEEE